MREWNVNTKEYIQRLTELVFDPDKYEQEWLVFYKDKNGNIVGKLGSPYHVHDGNTTISCFDYLPCWRAFKYFVNENCHIPYNGISLNTIATINPFDMSPELYKECTENDVLYILIFKSKPSSGIHEDAKEKFIEYFHKFFNTNVRFRRTSDDNVLVGYANGHINIRGLINV